ncbi:hypothetical protein JYU34_002404 [Plutella xylostella]|uniref:Transmembrane and coiled-coil domain-containing protein 7 n=1 Tax=Plutella xylostella TaxID=51655 RepID=A0ABQ7R239_PLUXY|nr:hypothetical protein JYU34_002404 [Plutella xylostella]
MNENDTKEIFARLETLTSEDGHNELGALLKQLSLYHNGQCESPEGNKRKDFLGKIIKEIDNLASRITDDHTILVSVKNQKVLRTCFQLITSIGIAPCMIPGVGISLSKRCISAIFLPPATLSDEDKYELLVGCTDFFTRSYKIPVLKNIILTLHLSDYLASLIQLSFAPLKKPGIYENYTMSQERYAQLSVDRQKFVQTYNYLVTNCFQPILMKELLILQSVTNPSPPAFVKRIVSKEMNNRLLSPGGLLSLIRCFIESYNIDMGYEWKKIDMICKIVSCKHGSGSENDYLHNICSQLTQILCLNNTHYLTTAVACALSLSERYPQSAAVKQLMDEVFQAFDYNHLISKSDLPGTIILSSQEIEHNVNILHACMGTMKLNWPIELIMSKLYILFQLGVNATRSQELKIKIKHIILKCLSVCTKEQVLEQTKLFLFGLENNQKEKLLIEEFDAGLIIKYVKDVIEYPRNEALIYYLELFNSSTDNCFIESAFEAALNILVDISKKRGTRCNDDLLTLEDNPEIFDHSDQQYAIILQLLTEISASPKVMASLKKDVSPVMGFVEYFLVHNKASGNEECITIALVLLNTFLTATNSAKEFEKKITNLLPVLQKMSQDTSNLNHILCKEALSYMSSELPAKNTAFERAVSDVFDGLLPVRAHGIIELTRLIESRDPEALSKKHYIFCIFQDQLKDPDSYIYLSAINGISALGSHCTEDVLHVLCKEFLQVASQQNSPDSEDSLNKVAELRMKVGDIVVKVTKRLGEMAVVHKALLLNTMLCACRDDDPLVRTSALSNLAEIALVLNYKIGTIIYEVLLCIWSILETDKAIECRRAAVMVIASLLKGLGKDTLTELKENLLPVYRTLKNLYNDPSEDSILRLHAQLALEELNDIVRNFLMPELKREKHFTIVDTPEDVVFK